MMNSTGRMWRSRWAAIGAAVAVTLGAGGLISVSAASPQSVFVAISPTRVLDTRFDIGLIDAFQEGKARVLDVTGTVPIVLPGNVPGTAAPVPDGATAIVANVTVVGPTTQGFVSVRPGNATGSPTTSNLNFQAGAVVPNSVSVELAANGTINLFFRGTAASATTDLLVDIVGYYVEGSGGTPGPKGDTGSTGAAGTTGANGATGPRGFSAWDEIPSGVTVTGFEDITIYPTGTETNYASVSFPGVAPLSLFDAQINFAEDFADATGDDDPECLGGVNAPSAPPGKVCMYRGVSTNILNASARGVQNYGAKDLGFTMRFKAAAAGRSNIAFSWAYTAP